MMKFNRPAACAAMIVILLAASVAMAAEPVSVRSAWVRAPVAGQPVVGAYLEVQSERDAALVRAESAVAERVEMHTMTMEGGVMRMRPVARIALPAGEIVRLAPGGLHLMMFGLKAALEPGSRVPLTLTVQSADGERTAIKVQAEVRSAAPSMQHMH